jgi:hypothetical protein
VRWPPAWELDIWSNESVWDIRQLVRTLAEDTVRSRYQETTSKDIEDFICVLQLQ